MIPFPRTNPSGLTRFHLLLSLTDLRLLYLVKYDARLRRDFLLRFVNVYDLLIYNYKLIDDPTEGNPTGSVGNGSGFVINYVVYRTTVANFSGAFFNVFTALFAASYAGR